YVNDGAELGRLNPWPNVQRTVLQNYFQWMPMWIKGRVASDYWTVWNQPGILVLAAVFAITIQRFEGMIWRKKSTNETYISRMFNQGVGQSFNQTINDMRIRHAQTLIRQTPDQPLLEIAFAAGFNSKATFNRVFRARTGQTPSTWRDSDINAGPPASQNP
ncbi:MAG: helix-turn-helix domain-containing protein, partial [Pseudomonadota bacterium]